MADAVEQRRLGSARLLQTLTDRGLLTEPWRRVFGAVPRDLFIPVDIWRQGMHTCVPVTDDADWWDLVYSDEPVVIQVDDGAKNGQGVATSSNSQPSMVARMLELLEVEDSHRVLEIGTASGYLAALLCERLGEENVFSVELDPLLAERAQKALRAAGYAPTVAWADSERGWPTEAPYDRMVVTCALRHVPAELVAQVAVGGVIVAPLTRRFLTGALVQLTVQADGTASGQFRGGASYMPMRSHRPSTRARVDQSSGRERTGGLDPQRICHLAFSQYAGARLPEVSMVTRQEGGVLRVWLDDGAGSGTTTATGDAVWEYGSRSLWQEVEKVYDEYVQLGSPEAEEFGLTVSGREQYAWLGAPSRVIGSAHRPPAGP